MSHFQVGIVDFHFDSCYTSQICQLHNWGRYNCL